jgi:rRNA maturation endonuclease Nob1
MVSGPATVMQRKIERMAFPVKVCVACEEEFELRPDKPGFANRCPQCSAPDADVPASKTKMSADELKTSREGNAARRAAIKDMLYSGK